MGDCFTKKVRSRVMSAVKSSGNKTTELKLISIFRQHDIVGWRRKQNTYGHPDFIFYKQKIAVFTDGCFWHGHSCKRAKPKNNAKYWDDKVKNNIKRDNRNSRVLRRMGWHVLRIWECKINNAQIPKQLKLLLNHKKK